MPLHPSSPPLLDDDGGGEIGSEDDEFGDFGEISVGPSCSSGFDGSHGPPSSLRYSSPSMKPATHPTNSSFNHPVEQSQHTSAEMVNRQDCDSESQLTNGYSERNHSPTASAGGACSPQEETGFADFTVFTGQAAHPWCCGFTPLVGTQEKNSPKSLGEKICESKQEVIMESEPRSYIASQTKENICTVEHCEKRDAALMQPSQDQQQPQEAAAAALDFPTEQSHSGEESLGNPEASKHGYDSLATAGMQEDGASKEDSKNEEKMIHTVSQTFSVCESASDASLYDDLSFDGPSADLEPNVSSLGSPEDQTDWDQTDDEEETGNFGHSDPSVINNSAISGESKTGTSFYYRYRSATQDTFATSLSGTNTDRNFADLRDCGFQRLGDQDCVQTAGAGVQILGNLPPSDSFADFCSAPTQEEGEESWAVFKDLRAQEERSWTQSQEQVSNLKIDGSTEEEGVRQHGETREDSCQVGNCYPENRPHCRCFLLVISVSCLLPLLCHNYTWQTFKVCMGIKMLYNNDRKSILDIFFSLIEKKNPLPFLLSRHQSPVVSSSFFSPVFPRLESQQWMVLWRCLASAPIYTTNTFLRERMRKYQNFVQDLRGEDTFSEKASYNGS